MFSRKLQLGWLRLQIVAGYNWEKQKPTLDYRYGLKGLPVLCTLRNRYCLLREHTHLLVLVIRITTKWGEGPRRRGKERVGAIDIYLFL